MPTAPEVRQKLVATWGAGDYSKIAWFTEPLGNHLVQAVEVPPGSKVLDVATGTGHVALAAARRFAETTGLDIVPELIEVARARAAAERLPNVEFVVGDAQDIQYPDGTFDYVLSAIGAMFAPDQEKTASELLRVAKPGGTVGVLSWIPTGFLGELFKLMGRYVTPPPGFKPPALWGSEDRVRELFPNAANIAFKPGQISVRMPDTAFYADFMATNYGPTVKAIETLSEEQRTAFRADLVQLFESFNTAADGTLALRSDFTVAIVTKR